MANKTILPANVNTVKRLGKKFEKPYVYFKPTVQHISNKPANNKLTHANNVTISFFDKKHRFVLTGYGASCPE